ncbi:MAG: hypothetical protein A2W09_05650, partial [Deltaproteobacteria bacterium RBG_16_50_11]
VKVDMGYTFHYRTVVKKQTAGTVPPGTWTFAYSQGTNKDYTQIDDPCGRIHKYSYYGYGNDPPNGSMWMLGLPKSKEIVGEETVAYEWIPSSPISSDHYEVPLVGYDNDIYVPYLAKKTIVRDGKTYTTNYNNYDPYGNPKTISESGENTRNRQLTYWYNIPKNIVQNKPLSETVSGSFPGTFMTTYTYDPHKGNLLQLNRYGVITQYTYYLNGNLRTQTDANGMTTSYLWTNGRISKITNPLYSISRVINPNGTLAGETNGGGYKTSFTYDGNLRLKTITPPVGNPTNFTYPQDNSYRLETRGQYYTYHYNDGFGRPTGSEDIKGIETDMVYKSCGLKDTSTSNIGDTVYYDPFGRVKQITHKDNTKIAYDYLGSDVTLTDEEGYKTLFTYNAFGNPDEKLLVGVKDALLTVTSYDYNILGSLLIITQETLQRAFSYDPKNFLISESHPEKGTIAYTRDNVGNLKTKTDGLGMTTYTYDAINRLKGIDSKTEIITFGYDHADNRTSMSNASATTTYAYDASNRMTEKKETILGRTYSTRYVYDGNDNLTDIYYPSGNPITYVYNSKNQVTEVRGLGWSVNKIAYYTTGTSIGLPQSFTSSNGLTTYLTYNKRNLTTDIEIGSPVLDMGYEYDARGNMASITNYLDPSKNQAFAYDKLNRLTTFDGPWGMGSSSYDSKGNRLNKKIATGNTEYRYLNNRLMDTVGGEPFSFGYNSDGDPTYVKNTLGMEYSLKYDKFHNLLSYDHNAGPIATFTYDGDGMRLTKTSGNKTMVYHYDKEGKVISEGDEFGNFLSDYVYLNGKLILKVMNDAFVPPDGPTNLKASMVAPDAVNLSWKDNSTNEIKFRIERKTGGDGSYAEIGAVNANITTYSDPGLSPGGTYLYKVRASNAGGDSGNSNEAQVTLRTSTISATADPNGNIVPQGNISIYYGADQTFTITPDMGYHVAGVSIDGPNMGVLSTYTFNNVTSDHAIHATFEINPPKISVSPSSHNFGNIYLGTTPIAQSFILSNTGTVSLVIGSITLTGTNANEFNKAMDGCSGRTIVASESCVVQVVFSPTSAGEKSAALTIPSNDPLTPIFNAPLSGTVVEGRSLTVIRTGNGMGTVTSSPPGINCGDDCSELYIKGIVVTLTATIPSDSIFTGWTGGGCSGTGNC